MAHVPKWGNQGPSVWPECNRRGIIAMGYWQDGRIIVDDCSKYTVTEYNNIWKGMKVKRSNEQVYLRSFAYSMEEGDYVYIKNGPDIVAKGTIGKYEYDTNIFQKYKIEGQ